MAKLKTMGNRIPTADLRRVKPPEKQADAELLNSAHMRWRRAVLSRAGWQCQAIMPDGSRCPVRHPERLYADHVAERQDAPHLRLDVTNGSAMCPVHHQQKTLAARQQRMGLPVRNLGWTLAPQQEPVPEPKAAKPDLNAPGRLTIA